MFTKKIRDIKKSYCNKINVLAINKAAIKDSNISYVTGTKNEKVSHGFEVLSSSFLWLEIIKDDTYFWDFLGEHFETVNTCFAVHPTINNNDNN